jgi:hypothetical protein
VLLAAYRHGATNGAGAPALGRGFPVDRGTRRNEPVGRLRRRPVDASVPEPRTASVSISSNFASTLTLLLGSNVSPSVVSISSSISRRALCRGQGSATLSWRSPARPARRLALLVTKPPSFLGAPATSLAAAPVHGSRSVARRPKGQAERQGLREVRRGALPPQPLLHRRHEDRVGRRVRDARGGTVGGRPLRLQGHGKAPSPLRESSINGSIPTARWAQSKSS